MAHHSHDRDRILARVRRIGGLIAAIERSVEGDAPCRDTLHLVAGVRGAVGGLMDELIEEQLREHVAAPGLSDAERSEAAQEIATLLRRYAK
ncbi:metal-sensing transcriptional repressor [Altererythrobacter xixiisoli]|uniref:Metal-sensing transcriptional repressor n=1 Tax=Croceibacterium xixiisoli TaxID=1476466 RepID=A0A6I4TW36_9SPHN|nr:metal/formaldehyde-sensitive transcriptional repressor [Croceibacterium xixiisoli]MXP00416.1 metal-sensing transcriptional repressor [Croceibacterium xixiisoli]